MTHVIEAESLTKSFGTTKALAGVSITAERGQVLALLGPNGAGKTTVVRILSTLLRPDSGRASICGYDVLSQAVQVRQLIALTGQYASVDEELTGTENLLMIGRLLGLSRAAARSRAAATRAATTGLDSASRRSFSNSARLTGRRSTLTSTRSSSGPDSRAR